MFFFWPICISL